AAQGPLEGVVRPVACGRRRRGRQGGGGGSRRLSHTLYVGDPGGAAERLAAGGVVLCPLPPGRRLPRPEATPGLGRVPGLDAPADRADHASAVCEPDVVAPVAVPLGGRWRGGVVAAATVEPAQDTTQCLGSGASAATA